MKQENKIKLSFFVNKQREIILLKDFLRKNLFEKKNIHINNFDELQSEFKRLGEIDDNKIELYVDNIYKSYGSNIEKTTELYQESWNEINDKFFDLMLKKTNLKSPFNLFKCHVSTFFRGLSSWGGDTITRDWDISSFTMRKITAHEIVIAYIWNHLKEIFPKNLDKDNWAIAELTAWVMLSYDKDFIKLWPWFIDKGTGLGNYSQLIPHIQKTKELYISSNNFKDFLVSIDEIVR